MISEDAMAERAETFRGLVGVELDRWAGKEVAMTEEIVCDSLNMCKKRESWAINGPGFLYSPNFCPWCGKPIVEGDE